MPLFKKTGQNEYTINIRGTIGVDISGAAIAETIEYLNEQGAKRIIEKINSNGGYIEDGFNIINANLVSNATIETINTGAAGSIAAVILASGDVRKAYDNSYALIHDPQISGETLEKIEDQNLKNNLLKVKNTLVKTLVDACKKSENFISNLMTRETAFTAKEQKEFGLVDKIIKSRVKPPKSRNLADIMNHFKNVNSINSKNMDEITNYLNLNSDASEKNILAAIKAINKEAENHKKNLDSSKQEIEVLKSDLSVSENDLKAANDKLKAYQDQAVKNAVDSAINAGKFTEDNREKLTEQASKDLDLFNNLVNEMPVIHKSIINEIQNNNANKGGATDEVKDWDFYQKNDPDYLKQLENTNVAEFKKLYEAYWQEKYEPAKN